MIVVDSSALLAIIFDEPERQSFEDLSPRRAMPPVGGERARDSLRPSRATAPAREAMAIAGDSEVEIVAATDVIACSPS